MTCTRGLLLLGVILGLLAGSATVEPATRELVNTDSPQTLSNKTLVSPVLQGNAGIGTTSPQNTLDVRGGINVGNATNGSLADGSSALRWTSANNTNTAFGFLVNTGLWFQGDFNRTNPDFGVRGVSSDSTGALSSNVFFVVKGLTGNVGIGTTNPQAPLDVNGKIYFNDWLCNSGGGNCVFLDTSNHLRPTYNAGLDLGDPNNRFSTLYLNATGYKPGGGSWTDYSDERLKKNVKPLAGALDRLLRLRGVTYQWKDPATRGNLTGTQIGMVAQEVEEVFPNWVATDKTGYKTLTFRGFEALTVEALRELKKENDGLRREIQELKAKLSRVEKVAPSRT